MARFEFRTQLGNPQTKSRSVGFDSHPIASLILLIHHLFLSGEIQAQGLVDPFMLTPAEPAYTWSRVSGGLGDRLGNLPGTNRGTQKDFNRPSGWLGHIRCGQPFAVSMVNTTMAIGGRFQLVFWARVDPAPDTTERNPC